MPKNVPFHKLSNKAKRKKIIAEENKISSTDSSIDNDVSHVQQLHTFIDTHIEPADHFIDKPSCSSVCSQSELFKISGHHSELSDNFDENFDLDSPSSLDLSSNSSNFSQSDNNTFNPQWKVLKFLRGWALKYNITHEAVSNLLAGLKENHECFVDNDESNTRFPTDAQTLLKTNVKLSKKIVEPRSYIHIGLKNQLLKIAPKYFKNVPTFKLLINIDGLPLYLKVLIVKYIPFYALSCPYLSCVSQLFLLVYIMVMQNLMI